MNYKVTKLLMIAFHVNYVQASIPSPMSTSLQHPTLPVSFPFPNPSSAFPGSAVFSFFFPF